VNRRHSDFVARVGVLLIFDIERKKLIPRNKKLKKKKKGERNSLRRDSTNEKKISMRYAPKRNVSLASANKQSNERHKRDKFATN
jgi:hypothetical protein